MNALVTDVSLATDEATPPESYGTVSIRMTGRRPGWREPGVYVVRFDWPHDPPDSYVAGWADTLTARGEPRRTVLFRGIRMPASAEGTSYRAYRIDEWSGPTRRT